MNLAALRQQAGLTQEELADLTGLTTRTIRRIEAGDTIPRAYTLRKLAEALKITVEDLQKVPAPPDLRWLNLSCFFFLVIPYVHFLIPVQIWKKNKTAAGKRIVDLQIYWTIALHAALILTLCYNLLVVRFFDWPAGVVSYLLVVVLLYAVNVVIILGLAFPNRLRQTGR